MSSIDEVRSRLDIVDVVGSYVKLARSGRNYKGLSPFQSERSPSFFVFPDTQTFKDFSSGEQGDVFSFVMKKEGWTFGEALRELARRAGVQLEERTPDQKKSADHETRLREALTQAAEYFHHLLITSPQATNCRAYVRDKRHLSDETVKTWQIGYSLMDYQALSNYMSARSFNMQELIDAGLVIESEEGRRYDRFRGRLMIPIRDAKGQVVGFGSRSLDGSEPKYMNSPQTQVFDKGRLLFGLDRARNAIRNDQASVLVEGYMDVIGCHQAGFINVVAGMGTSLTEDQFKSLKRLAPRIVLALDADAAGNRAVLRGVDVARDALDRDAELMFDPRGVIRSESKLNADIRVAVLPDGKDPDEIVLEAPEQWRAAVANARPVIEHVIDVMLQGYDVTNPHQKSQAVRAIAPILLDTSDAVQRDFYVQQIARRLQISPRAIMQVMNDATRELRAKRESRDSREMGAAKATPPAPPAPAMPARLDMQPGPPDESSVPAATAATAATAQTERAKTGPFAFDFEAHLIAVLARRPQLLLDANVALTRANLTVLGPDDFLNPALRLGFIELSRAAMGQPLPQLDPDTGSDADDWLAIIADQDIAESLLSDDLLLREEAVRTALRLRERNLNQQLKGINMLVDEARQSGEVDVAARYNLEHTTAKTQLLRVHRALRLRSALNVT
jgi:DNA primase